MAFSIKAVLIFPVMENPPDLAYDCMKGSRILAEKETKQNYISQSKKEKENKKSHQPPPKKSPKRPNHQPPQKSTLALSGY